MMFAAPLWLTVLAPLAAVVAYLLLGRRRQEGVPFLDLWIGPVTGPRPTRRFAAPPLAVALAILAMLLAVLGAARPALWNPRGAAPLTIIVDRGATMSAGYRWGGVADAVQKELMTLDLATPIDLLVIPGAAVERTDLAKWRLETVKPTAIDTTAALHAAIAGRLAERSGPVIVMTDRPLGMTDDRVVFAAPRRSVGNVGITLVAARAAPRAQVMVRIRNDAVPDRFLTTVKLRIRSGGRDVARPIEFPSAGGSRDFFFDVETLGDVVEVELPMNDHFRADNTAWLVREGSPPRLEARGSMPPELRRMVDVYAGSRPPVAESPKVTIVEEVSALPPASAGVILADARDATAANDVQLRPHPVTRDTRWLLGGSIRLAAPPPAEWTPVVRFGERVAVAVRQAPARQVWVGIDSDEWPRTPDYVVFWANVFDWLGGGETRFASYAVGQLEGAWEAVDWEGDKSAPIAGEPGLWPGLYRRGEDGALRAVNAGEVRLLPPPDHDWKPKLRLLLDARARGAARPIASAVVLAAAGCAALAVVMWKRSPARNPAST